MPSFSDLDFYFNSVQRNEFRYLTDMWRKQERWHDDEQNARRSNK